MQVGRHRRRAAGAFSRRRYENPGHRIGDTSALRWAASVHGYRGGIAAAILWRGPATHPRRCYPVPGATAREAHCGLLMVANPLALIAEITHRCPLHCVYCSNPLELAAANSELKPAALLRG